MTAGGVAAALNGLRTNGGDLVVSLDDPVDGPMWLAMTRGEISVGRGRHPKTELELRRRDGSVLLCLARELPGWEAAATVEVKTQDGEWALHPPFDVGPQGVDAEIIPNATVTVLHSNFDSPLGNLRYRDVFGDGRLVDRIGGVGPADVVVHNSFTKMIRSLEPDRPLLEAIDGAQAHARDVSLLLVVAGLYESPALRSHLGRRRRENELLCRLSEHTSSGAWQSLFPGAVNG